MTVPGFSTSAAKPGMSRGAISWALFEGGRDPYIVLIVIYVFMPYVASVMVGDPVKGQETLSRWNQYVGWAVMLTAPFLGASIDKLGPRKAPLALVVGLMAPMIAALWWARPDGSGLSVGVTMFLAMSVNLLFTYSEILHNSLLVRAAGIERAHTASGLALVLGNLFSVFALVFTLWAFALPGKVDWAWVPASPLFGLDAASHEPERVVALMAAGLLLTGALPLFLFTPDAPRTGIPLIRVLKEAAAELLGMFRQVRRHRDAATFLISRMFFVDGMNAVLIYSGVYAVGIMKWGALEMLAYGILLSVLSAVGGVVGPWLDTLAGPRRSLQIQIVAVIIGLLALLGMSPDKILYVWAYDPLTHARLWNGPVFSTLPDLLFVAFGAANAVFVCASYASSRTLLTRITPPDQTGAFFGVYALSGVATSWLGPTLVNFGTRATDSQQGGFATITLLLGLGLLGMLFVRGGGRLKVGPASPSEDAKS